MLTYLLISITWCAIVFLPPYLAYRRPVDGQREYRDNAIGDTPDSGLSF